MRLQRHPLIEIAPQPAPRSFALPVHGMLRAGALTPSPSRLAPEFTAAVALCLDEFQEFRLRHGRARDGERLHVNRVRPFFVVKDKWLLVSRTQEKTSARNFHVCAQRPRSG